MSFGCELDLPVARAAVFECPERDQHRSRVAGVALRRKGERLANRSAAVGARPVDTRHQLCRASVGVHPKDLEDRRRAADLFAHSVARGNAVRG